MVRSTVYPVPPGTKHLVRFLDETRTRVIVVFNLLENPYHFLINVDSYLIVPFWLSVFALASYDESSRVFASWEQGLERENSLSKISPFSHPSVSPCLRWFSSKFFPFHHDLSFVFRNPSTSERFIFDKLKDEYLGSYWKMVFLFLFLFPSDFIILFNCLFVFSKPSECFCD